MSRKITRADILKLGRSGRSSKKAVTAKQVRAIAKKVVMKTTEAKHTHWVEENQQLFHNTVNYKTDFYRTSQGFDDNQGPGQTGFPAGTDIREGDQIYLNNINLRLWLSNKGDRPNCMYRIVIFEYDEGETVDNTLVWFTQGNKMLDRLNNKKINVLASKYVKSTNNYALDGKEHSYITTMNVHFKKPKKIVYPDNSSSPKNKNLGFCVVAYDAFGTLVGTDNICSYAYDMKLTFRDP